MQGEIVKGTGHGTVVFRKTVDSADELSLPR